MNINYMNVIPAYLKNRGRTLLAAAAVACSMISCDDAIYDYEGDCSVTYRMAFRYDRNMKWADAFAHEVKSVHLYAFDRSGTLVWQKAERGEALKADGYAMTIDLPAGDYRMLAWCGLENDGQRPESFTVPQARVGETTISDLQCSLNRTREASGAVSRQKLYGLYHGICDVSLPVNDDGGEYTYTMDLTKDTNHVRVILQQLSGQPVNEKDFTFRIEDENGLLDYDNSPLADEMITYWAYDVHSGTAGLGIDDYPVLNGAKASALSARDALSSPLSSPSCPPVQDALSARDALSSPLSSPSCPPVQDALSSPSRATITSVSVAIADIAISRLIAGHDTYLTINTADGRTAARIKLTDAALMLKDAYDEPMTDQDYLDRQDEYSLTFFLDEDRTWIETSIIINSWKVVLNKVDFGS